jgi:hypothetical protein
VSADRPGVPIPDDRAVVDRIVDGVTAVLLVGPNETELLLPSEQLPEDAREGTWLALDLAARPPAVIAVDHSLTEVRAADLNSRLQQIRRDRSAGRFQDR